MNIKIDKSSPSPIYEQVKKQIRSHFINNNVKEGTLLPDIKKLASIAGVSTWAVDRALRELIEEEVCYRRPKKGTFVGSLKSLREQKAICGICHASGLDSFERDLIQATIYRGISRRAHEKHMDTFFLPSEPVDSISFYSARSSIDLKGVIMLHWEEIETITRLAERFTQIKFIHINYYLKDFELTPPNVYGIFNDEYAGAYQAVEYLIQKGHRKISALGVSLMNENYRQRLAGHRDALKDNGLPYRKDFVHVLERALGEDLRETGRRIAAEVLSQNLGYTAFFCVNDLIAEGAVICLKDANRQGDIEIFGYDNVIPNISLDSKFSTVKVEFQKMGEKAVDILTNETGRHFPKVLRITPRLLVRNMA